MLGKLIHCAHEASREELLRDIQALKLVHSLDLLLALGSGIVQSLIFLLNEVDFTLNLLLPLLLVVFLALLVLLFKLADLLKLSLLLNFENSLLD